MVRLKDAMRLQPPTSGGGGAKRGIDDGRGGGGDERGRDGGTGRGGGGGRWPCRR